MSLFLEIFNIVNERVDTMIEILCSLAWQDQYNIKKG